MRGKVGYFIAFLFITFLPTISHALQNGGFEQTEPNELLDFDPPAHWQRQNYAAIVTNFKPQPTVGSVDNWKIDVQAGLNPIQGQSFVVLSSGDINPDPSSASINQSFQATAGETISGYYFFGTCDYEPYNDYAEIKLLPAPGSQLNEITLVSVDVLTVGHYSSMSGWELFEHTFTSAEAGLYSIDISVNDARDTIYASYLAVDGITPEPSTAMLLAFGVFYLTGISFGHKR